MTVFSPWLHWDARLRAAECDHPGVYLLARFEEGPPPVVDPIDRRVLLIAETHGQTLRRRWDQFQYSAFRGGSGHAGGNTFHRLYGNGPDDATPPWLYVAAVAVPDGTADVQGYVQGQKNRLLANYQDRHGLLPCCNVRGPVEFDEPPEAVENPRDESQVPAAVTDLQVAFGPWCQWAERERMNGLEAAGVYALACFEAAPPAATDVLDEAVVYLGETCDNTLAGRLWQFERSAFQAKAGHSGGWSFAARCAGLGDRLYVSVFPVTALHEPFRSAFIRHTERLLLWEYVRRWGRRPVCNSK